MSKRNIHGHTSFIVFSQSGTLQSQRQPFSVSISLCCGLCSHTSIRLYTIMAQLDEICKICLPLYDFHVTFYSNRLVKIKGNLHVFPVIVFIQIKFVLCLALSIPNIHLPGVCCLLRVSSSAILIHAHTRTSTVAAPARI